MLFLTWSFCLQACLSLQPVSSLSYPKFLCACPTAGSLEVWWLGGSCWLDSRVLRGVLFGRWMDCRLGKSHGSKRAWRKWPLVSQSLRNELNFQTPKLYRPETEHWRFRIKRKLCSKYVSKKKKKIKSWEKVPRPFWMVLWFFLMNVTVVLCQRSHTVCVYSAVFISSINIKHFFLLRLEFSRLSALFMTLTALFNQNYNMFTCRSDRLLRLICISWIS